MASKLAPFSAFFSGFFLFFFLGLAPAIGQGLAPAIGQGLAPTIGQNHTEKIGVCPEVLESQDCPVECRTDRDCPDVHKCCKAGCTSVCIIPNEKKGKCPDNDSSISMLGICKDECFGDSDCSGPLKCCVNGCGNHSCLTPDH